MLQIEKHQDTILLRLKDKVTFEILKKLISSLSEMHFLPKPHAFDATGDINIYGDALIKANEAAVHDMLHEVDVVLKSYQREIISKFFKILNILSEISIEKAEKVNPRDRIPFIKEIKDDSSSTSQEFTGILQKVFIKWVNFEDELGVSLQIIDFLNHFERNFSIPEEQDIENVELDPEILKM